MNDDGLVQTFKYTNIFSDNYYDETYDHFNDSIRNYRQNNRLIYASNLENPFYNPVLNGSFEVEVENPYWELVSDYGSDAYIDYVEGVSVSGESSARISFLSGNMDAYLEQEIELQPGQYQLSAYIRNESQPYQSYENLAYLAVDGTTTGLVTSECVEPGPEWNYVTVTFNVPITENSDTSSVVIRLVNETYGSVYFDAVEIRQGFNTNNHNLFENGSFEREIDTSIWQMSGNIERQESSSASTDDILFDILGKYSMKLSGNPTEATSLITDITPIVGTTPGEEYSIKLWGYSEGTPRKIHSSYSENSENGKSSFFKVIIDYFDANGNAISVPNIIFFDQQVEGWQRLTVNITIPEGTGIVTLSIEYMGLGDVFVDGLGIEQNYSGTIYKLSENGNVIESISDNGERKVVSYIEDKYNRPIDSTPTSISSVQNNIVAPLNEDLLPSYYENNNVRMTPSYDEFGRPTEITYGDSSLSFTTSTIYGVGLYQQFVKKSTK
jgi:hypothetical protein